MKEINVESFKVKIEVDSLSHLEFTMDYVVGKEIMQTYNDKFGHFIESKEILLFCNGSYLYIDSFRQLETIVEPDHIRVKGFVESVPFWANSKDEILKKVI